MKNFVLLYSGGSMPEDADMAQVMKDWEAWYGQLGSAVVDPGNPIGPSTKYIASNGSVSNGSSDSTVTGYTILQADSLDAAAKMAESCPVLQGGSDITVFETFSVM